MFQSDGGHRFFGICCTGGYGFELRRQVSFQFLNPLVFLVGLQSDIAYVIVFIAFRMALLQQAFLTQVPAAPIIEFSAS